MNKLFIIYFLCVIFLQFSKQQRINLKICSKSGNQDVCQQIARKNDFACNENYHSVDCILNIENEKSHFGKISEEEAFLAANLVSEKIVVIGEVNGTHPPSQTVVLVRNDILTDTTDLKSLLKSKKFCHPGFSNMEDFSFYLLQELENKLIDDSELCSNSTPSLLESRIKALAGFLGESCRPGPWTSDLELDKTLKNKYSSLCTLCGSSGCSVNYMDPFNDNLRCLTTGGDFALTTLQKAQDFMNIAKNKDTYKYLCKDGTTKSEACAWTEPIPSLIIAHQDRRDDVLDILKKYIGNRITNSGSSDTTDPDVANAVLKVLSLEKTETIQLFSAPKSLSSYVNDLRPSPTLTDSKKCNLSVKWCTRSDGEQAKCQWYSQAARNRGFQPVIECTQSDSTGELSCLTDIEKGKADIVTTSADYAFLTLIQGLTSVAYPETDSRFLPTILLVKNANNTNINSFQDVKGKKACFPQYGGKEYLAFIETARSFNLVSESDCNYGEIFDNLVGSSCVPGANYLVSESKEDLVDTHKLCELCKSSVSSLTASNCGADYNNAYHASNGSILCLRDQAADFAVITRPFDHSNMDDLHVICKNGSLANKPGLDVDDNCALNVIISGEVVVKAENAYNKNIALILEESERWFGKDLWKTFHLFDRFNNTKHFLFKDSTLGITGRSESQPIFVANYRKLLKKAEECYEKKDATTTPANGDTTPPSKGSVASITFTVFVISTLISLFLY